MHLIQNKRNGKANIKKGQDCQKVVNLNVLGGVIFI